MVFSEMPCPIQCGDSSAAEVIKAMLGFQCHFPLLASLMKLFPACFRINSRDRGSGNLRYERSLWAQAQSAGICSLSLGLLCSVHVVHTAFGLGLSLVSSTVSSVIAMALAMQVSASFGKLQRAAKRVLLRRVEPGGGGHG